ncbi:MAG: MarR family transcriptional regulator [Chloroflexi bacterium]|nr:MarR family transcriptional regulator [Chloroflexota bacterium]
MSPPLLNTLREWLRVTMQFSMRHFMQFAKQNNYSIPQLNALFRIRHKGACGVSDLGEEMGVTNAAASQLLDKLVQQGLVTRTEDPQDRRNKLITLTEAGLRVSEQSMQARQGWLDQLAASLTPAEQAQIQAALQLLIERAKALETERGADS